MLPAQRLPQFEDGVEYVDQNEEKQKGGVNTSFSNPRLFRSYADVSNFAVLTLASCSSRCRHYGLSTADGLLVMPRFTMPRGLHGFYMVP